MTISNYLCHMAGEAPARVQRLQESSQRRLKAFAIALHIPVTLWALTGYVIASRVFSLDQMTSMLTATFCAGLIYMVERLVLATPKSWPVNLGRLFIGTVIALLGASAVDLAVFEREVTQQLRAAGEARITAEFNRSMTSQGQEVDRKKTDWMNAQEAANCEANGTCGSRMRNVGPVYREMARQAALWRQDYEAAQASLEALDVERGRTLAAWRDSPRALTEAGLLSRLEALHQYTTHNTMARIAWLLFFALVLSLELMVVIAKLVFGETVDDEIGRIREEIIRHKAREHGKSATAPGADVRRLLEHTAC